MSLKQGIMLLILRMVLKIPRGWKRLGKIVIKLFRPKGRQVVGVGNLFMDLDFADPIAVNYYSGKFEKHNLRLILKHLKKGNCFFDCGANEGYITLRAAEAVGQSGQVHAFEANPQVVDILRGNIKRNRNDNVVKICPKALTDFNGTAVIFPHPESSGWGTLYGKPHPDGYAEGVNVASITLDSYAAVNNIDHIDFLKMDIEGSEFPALRGAHNILSRRNRPYLIVELWHNHPLQLEAGWSSNNLLDFLAELDYDVYRIRRRGRLEKIMIFEETSKIDAFCVPRERGMDNVSATQTNT